MQFWVEIVTGYRHVHITMHCQSLTCGETRHQSQHSHLHLLQRNICVTSVIYMYYGRQMAMTGRVEVVTRYWHMGKFKTRNTRGDIRYTTHHTPNMQTGLQKDTMAQHFCEIHVHKMYVITYKMNMWYIFY